MQSGENGKLPSSTAPPAGQRHATLTSPTALASTYSRHRRLATPASPTPTRHHQNKPASRRPPKPTPSSPIDTPVSSRRPPQHLATTNTAHNGRPNCGWPGSKKNRPETFAAPTEYGSQESHRSKGLGPFGNLFEATVRLPFPLSCVPFRPCPKHLRSWVWPHPNTKQFDVLRHRPWSAQG